MKIDSEIEGFAREVGLIQAGEAPQWTALRGGVSSDIWRLDSGGRRYCLKRALAKLRVVDEWTAPVGRNLHEWLWFETVGARFADVVPKLIARDEARGVFAMAFLEPSNHRLWKGELLAGRADIAFASEVGRALGRIHAATAGDQAIAAQFATDACFYDLRLDAYLLAAGRRQPCVAARLEHLVARTAERKLALVHGDVSPKNIMIGPRGPVFLDAETAWWGDPAFDLAFCLNHLLLKQRVAPQATAALNASFDALASAYLAHVDWEAKGALEARAATLLPGLLLARVDGKSPVEYLPDEADRAPVRNVAIGLLRDPVATLDGVRAAWARI
jgi:fructosamine-3-kinase